ncbi:hypothetical protein VA596_24335 [Amycolatopsis sp., V23-08]|uniref:Uncharacterized protein n=1 Tax=Amycolatopsis heterodermiae TaxID=3110235 RepID=A0ABU5R8Z4_9PSEU|nr:hypothetical protein [Amycolatopsis sp., V23-08]MEA5362686.1 hypothetical protein [Amycolatopsis sp., V23-08]
MKSVVWWSIGLLFGLSLVALGLFGSGEPSAKVLCGSEEMRPGQTCDRTQYGLTTTETYEEKRQESLDSADTFKNGGRWVTFGIGTGVAGLCGWRLVVAIRRRESGSVVQGVPGQQVGFGSPHGSGAVAQTVPGQQAGFAPQPGYAPQGFPVRQDFPQQPEFQQQPGFTPPQGSRQQPGFTPALGSQQQPEFAPAHGPQQQPGSAPPQGSEQQPGFTPPQGSQQQPGFAPAQGSQQPGFAPPHGVQQAPPPGYQSPRGPYHQ